MTRLELPFPPSNLTPHAKGGWWSKAAATKRYRQQCALYAQEAGLHLVDAGSIRARVTIHRPNLRRDFQNCISCFKAGIDGLADVLRVDDRYWQVQFFEGDLRRPHGMIAVELEALADG